MGGARWAWPVMVVLTVVVCVAQEEPRAGAAGRDGTVIRVVMPFTPDGLAPPFREVERGIGLCHPSVVNAARADVWRCAEYFPLTPERRPERIFDPCFTNPFASGASPPRLACLASPWSDAVFFMGLRQPPVTTHPPDPDALPWALELVTGVRCVGRADFPRATSAVDVTYTCDDGSVVVGPLDRTAHWWTASVLSEGADLPAVVRVLTAWH